MIVPLREEILNEEPFLTNEVQFNLFHRILEGELAIALMSEDERMIALGNVGRSMWVWVDKSREKEAMARVVLELSSFLKDHKLQEMAGDPVIAEFFAENYAKYQGIDFKLSMGMESYYCPKVISPRNVIGEMILSEPYHAQLVAEFLAGFIKDSFGEAVTVDSRIPAAERMINSRDLFLWSANNRIVSMTYISHRSPRHARINSVYTPDDCRKKGYASALVAAVSRKILNEGLIPVLFADLKNSSSNKVYRNIGFKEAGKINEFRFIY